MRRLIEKIVVFIDFILFLLVPGFAENRPVVSLICLLLFGALAMYIAKNMEGNK